MSALRDRHPKYTEHLERWELCADLFEGEHKIHEEGEKYLPKLQDEDAKGDKAYQLRLKMTPVFGALPRTVLGLRGMMFRKPMTVEVPPAIADMLEDIDLAGTTLQGLAQEVVEDALVVGRVGLLVDYPQTIPNATKADAAALNYRPMIVKYDAEAIYNWRPERINGATVLSQVRLEESEEVQDPKDEFKTTKAKRYRILDLVDGKYRQRLYSVTDKGNQVEETLIDEFFPQMNGTHLDFIPFVVIGVDCIGIDVEAPPLIDLATTVLHHYQQATSYERGCFFSGLPTLFISGISNSNDDGSAVEISIGGNLANILPRPDSKAYYVEVASEFNALRTNLEDKKREMAVLGARMLESQKAGVEAADAIARRMSGEESLLSIMAQTVSMGLTRALQIFSDWVSANGTVSVELNRDFMPAGLSSQDMAGLVSAWQQGALSSETLFNNLKAGEIIADDVTFEIEQERINSAALSFAAGSPTQPDMAAPVAPQDAAPAAEPAPPVDVAAIMQTMTDQHQTVLDQILQTIAAQAQPAPAVMAAPDTGMADMMQTMGDQHAAGMAAIADAMGKEQPAPTINVAAPVVNVTPAAPPAITIAPPVVNVAAPVINMPEQPITVNVPEQQPANVTVNNVLPDGSKTIKVERDKSGKIIGATAK